MNMWLENKYLSTLLLIGINILISGSLLQAQLNYTLSVQQQYSSNPFQLPETEGDQISEFSVGVQKNWQKFSLQYFGSYIRFNQNLKRNFYWHQLFLSGGDATNWYVRLDNRLNRTDYNIYDYFIAQGGLNQRLSKGNYLLRFGINGSFNRYQELDELNNILLKFYGSINRSFQTKTSIIGALSFNYKSYLDNNFELTSPEESVTDISKAISILNGGGNGPGSGRGGPGHGDGTGAGQWYYPEDAEMSNAVSQMVLSLRIAQSLSTYTGIAVQYYNRISLTEGDRSIAGLADGYQMESQIFDDPMGYSGQTYGIELTQIFPFRIKGRIAAYRIGKNYVSQGIYLDEINFNESILREEIRKTVWFTIQKQWDINLATLNWQIDYQWVDNESNSFWYLYNNQYISTGIQLDF